MQHPSQASQFWRHTLTLISGAGLSQVITFLALPFLARLYLPEAFGVAAIFIAAVLTLGVVINGGYEMAIMLPKDQPDAQRLTLLSIQVALGASAVVGVVAWIGGDFISSWDWGEDLRGWYGLLPISILLEGLGQPIRMFLNRIKYYPQISLSRIVKSLLQAGIALGFGLGDAGPGGLILGFMAGQLGGSLVLLYYYVRWANKNNRPIWLSGLGDIRRQYQDFPRFSILSTWLNTASRQLPFFLLPILYYEAGIGEVVNGYYSRADQILMAPMGLISMSVGGVFFEQASKAKAESAAALARITRQTFLRLLVMGLPFLIVIVLAGPILFRWVLGDNWETAGIYARWLAPWIYLTFMASPLSYLIDIQRKLKVFLYFTIVLFIIRFASIYLPGIQFPPLTTVMIYGAAGVVLTVLQLAYLLYIGGVWGKRKEKIV